MKSDQAKMLTAFLEFNAANPEVYSLFDKFVKQTIGRGYDHYSGWAVANRIRWHTGVEVRGSAYKFPNGFIAAYSRLWHQRNPARSDFIRIRHSLWDGLDLKTLTKGVK